MNICTEDRMRFANEDMAQGPWDDERETQRWLVEYLNGTGLFYVYEQVKGVPLFTHPSQQHHSLRADILVLPSEKLYREGWRDGAIVFEVKRPGEKIGRGLSQLIDYVNSVWYMSDGVMVVPSFGFLFWAVSTGGPLASIMSQQRIGTADLNRNDELELRCGQQTVMRFDMCGHVVKKGNLNFGHRIGSR